MSSIQNIQSGQISYLYSQLNGVSPVPSATNLAGGIASQIPFQSAPNTTSFIPNGTNGQFLKSNGTSAPSFATIPAVPADTLQQVLTAGSIAQAPLTLVINDTPNTAFTTLKGNSLDIEFDDGITPNFAEYSAFGINHNGDSLSLSTNGVLGFSSDNIFSNSAGLALTSTLSNSISFPILQINNTSATAGTTNGVPSVQYYKSGRNGANNDTICSQSFNANNSTGVKTEFAKIETTIRNVGVGNDDGSLSIFATLNGTSTEFMRINGADGDNNFLRPLDMNGSAINTSSGNMSISASASTGTGQITISPKTGSNLTIGTTPSGTNRTIINPDGTGINLQNIQTGFTGVVSLVNSVTTQTYLYIQQSFGSALKYIYVKCDASVGNSLESFDNHTPATPFKIKADNGAFASSNSSIELDMNPLSNPLVLAQLTFTHDNTLPASSFTPVKYIPVLIAGTQYYIPITTTPT